MSSALIIDALDSDFHALVLQICEQLGLMDRDHGEFFTSFKPRPETDPELQYEPSQDETFISIFNIATICLFNDYAAGLEGLSGTDAMWKTSFRNLPWWMESVWLPIEFDPPRQLVSVPQGPIFVGSSIRLLSELDRIRELSTINVTARPAGYTDMRTNFQQWFSVPQSEPLPDDDCVRWLWNAFREGAEISIEKQVPMLLAV